MTEKRKRGESLHAYCWLRGAAIEILRLSSSDSLRMTPRRRWLCHKKEVKPAAASYGYSQARRTALVSEATLSSSSASVTRAGMGGWASSRGGAPTKNPE